MEIKYTMFDRNHELLINYLFISADVDIKNSYQQNLNIYYIC